MVAGTGTFVETILMENQLAPAARATMLFQNGNFNDALKEYAHLLVTNPGSGYLYAMLGLCYHRLNKPEDAEAVVKKGMEEDSSHAGLYYVASCIRLKMNDTVAAEKFLLEALRLRPDDPDYHGVLSRLQNDRKEWQTGLETAKKGLSFQETHHECFEQSRRAMKKLGLIKGGFRETLLNRFSVILRFLRSE
jgi:predicted Zn-dependent protease